MNTKSILSFVLVMAFTISLLSQAYADDTKGDFNLKTLEHLRSYGVTGNIQYVEGEKIYMQISIDQKIIDEIEIEPQDNGIFTWIYERFNKPPTDEPFTALMKVIYMGEIDIINIKYWP